MSESTPRILWREIKKARRLRRYESLPVSHLVPEHRPLFVCRECKFTNLLVQLCPWCMSPCNTILIETAVRRRFSSPQFLNDHQREQLQRIEEQDRATGETSSISTTVAGFDITIPYSDPGEPHPRRRKRYRDAMAYTINLTLASTADDEDDVIRRPSPGTSKIALVQPFTESGSVAGSSLNPDGSCISQSSSPKTLRRKKRISLIRQPSSCSLKRKAMLSLPSPLPHRKARKDESKAQLLRRPSHLTFDDSLNLSLPSVALSEQSVPLGHPSRPLYSAIRKNMLGPTTPTGGMHLSQAAASIDMRERGMRSLDLPGSSRELAAEDYFSLSRTDRPWPMQRPTSGFSLSGEIELRMALERGHVDKLEEAAPVSPTLKPSNKRDINVKGRVKRFGKGLKDLMMLRI